MIFWGLLLAALVPLALSPVPPLVDYPDHLARMHVLADGGHDPLLARFYQTRWAVLPNLAMDAVVPFLARWIGLLAAGKLFVIGLALALAGGVAALSRAVHGRADPFALAGIALLYNYAFLQGLMNWLAGLALVLWGAALWIGGRDHPAWRRGVRSAVVVAALFFCHLYAVGLYGFILLCAEGRRLVRDWRLALAFALPFLPVPFLLAASPTAGLAGETLFSLGDKGEGLFWLIGSYNDGFDWAWGAGWAALLLLAPLRLTKGGWALLLAGAALFLVMPNVLMGAWGADVRLPVGLAFPVIGFIGTEFRGERGKRLFMAAVCVLGLLRFGEIGWFWHDLDAQIAEMRSSFAGIPPGSRILVAEADRPGGNFPLNMALSHAACLAAADRSAFVADLFAEPGKQVMAVRPDFLEQSNTEDGDRPALWELNRALDHPDPVLDQYWHAWRNRFDYLYILYTDGEAGTVPAFLTPVREGRRFRLYRIG